MKKELHPPYYPKAKVTCDCGHSFFTGSTLPELKVEICSECHPFYTGQEKLLDTEGRVEKFERKVSHARKVTEAKIKKEQKKEASEKKQKEQPKTLKEMLKEVQKT